MQSELQHRPDRQAAAAGGVGWQQDAAATVREGTVRLEAIVQEQLADHMTAADGAVGEIWAELRRQDTALAKVGADQGATAVREEGLGRAAAAVEQRVEGQCGRLGRLESRLEAMSAEADRAVATSGAQLLEQVSSPTGWLAESHRERDDEIANGLRWRSWSMWQLSGRRPPQPVVRAQTL